MVIVKRVSPLSLAKVQCLIMALFGVIVGIIWAIIYYYSSKNPQIVEGMLVPMYFSALGALLIVILMPIIYAVIGFILGLISAFFYNLIAGWCGGIEIELDVGRKKKK